ncbi:MAG: hypothetical protein L3J44_02660 [Campylobacteraceae bacterium]|nr:hypothetical protein [Campylobacteraceae bacterium]
MLFNINIFKSSYDIIPQATCFLRNQVLLKNIFSLLKQDNKKIKCFFHAGSTGEEVYSFLMYNEMNDKLDLEINVGEYEENALAKIKKAQYSENTIEVVNKNFLKEEFLRFFTKEEKTYSVIPSLREKLNDILLCDYTKIDKIFLERYKSDIVFCNNTLLYHEHEVQEKVLENLCKQASKYLIITGVENKALEKVLKRYSFAPYKENWEEIYDSWTLRRRSGSPIYKTPTTPFLIDSDKKKEHYFKYSIFIKS